MLAEINFLSVLVAAVAAFIVGAIWYSPIVFLPRWAREVGIDPSEDIANPGKVYGLTFIFTLLASLSMAIILPATASLASAVTIALVVGLGIVASSLGINYQFARNSTVHWLIDSGFHVVRLVVIAVVLSV